MYSDLDLIKSNVSGGPLVSNTNSEELELWMRDPIACIRELIDNPTFDDSMAYAPKKVYMDQEGHTC
ncbi:hypothetical protein HD554DRAFT_2019877 [Boletus coccyginus]|nr:hypothetical protein HD554DRAFT_2019877 [Boletus coccyginus]